MQRGNVIIGISTRHGSLLTFWRFTNQIIIIIIIICLYVIAQTLECLNPVTCFGMQVDHR